MSFRATILATVAVTAFAFAQPAQVIAQNADAKAGASAGTGGSGQMRGSGSAVARGPSTGGQTSGGHAENSVSMNGKSGKAGVQIGARSGGATIRERSQTRVGVSGGREEDVILHRGRTHGTIVYNDEPRRRVTIRESRPSVSISERTVGRTHLGGEVNVRTGGRSGMSATTGSATRMNQGQGAASKGANTGGSQTGGQAGVTGGSGGKQSGSSTTGQGIR
jgi:hypothetical protein